MALSPEQLDAITAQFNERERSYEKIIRICCGTGCITSGANRVYEGLLSTVDKEGLSSRILVKKTGCHGLCERGPIVTLVRLAGHSLVAIGVTSPAAGPETKAIANEMRRHAREAGFSRRPRRCVSGRD